jgi:hypothetical protein
MVLLAPNLVVSRLKVEYVLFWVLQGRLNPVLLCLLVLVSRTKILNFLEWSTLVHF